MKTQPTFEFYGSEIVVDEPGFYIISADDDVECGAARVVCVDNDGEIRCGFRFNLPDDANLRDVMINRITAIYVMMSERRIGESGPEHAVGNLIDGLIGLSGLNNERFENLAARAAMIIGETVDFVSDVFSEVKATHEEAEERLAAEEPHENIQQEPAEQNHEPIPVINEPVADLPPIMRQEKLEAPTPISAAMPLGQFDNLRKLVLSNSELFSGMKPGEIAVAKLDDGGLMTITSLAKQKEVDPDGRG